MKKILNDNFIGKLNKVSKLNKLTILLIIVLYITVVAVVGTLMHRTPVYKVDESAEEVFDKDVTFSTFIMNKLSVETEENEEKITNAYYVYTLADKKGEGSVSNVKYDLTLETQEDNYVYFDRMALSTVPYSNSKRNSITVKSTSSSNPTTTTYSYNNSTLKQEGIKTIFGKVNYSYSEDSETKTEVYTYKNNVLTLSEKELSKATTENTLVDYMNINFYLTSKETTYNKYAFTVSNLDLEVAHKLDIQAFVVRENGEIYPLCGIYNYADDDTQFSTTSKFLSSENQIANKLKVESVVLKVRLYTSETTYKEALIIYDYAKLVDDLRK